MPETEKNNSQTEAETEAEEDWADPAESLLEPAPRKTLEPAIGSLGGVVFYFAIMVLVAALIAYLGNLKFNLFDHEQIGAGVSEEAEAEKESQDSAGVAGMFSFGLAKAAFARPDKEPAAVVPSLPAVKPGLAELENLEAFRVAGLELDEARIEALADDAFFLKENDYIQNQEWGTNDFADTYAYFGGSASMYARQPQEALFITSDLGLHLFHLLIGRSFQEIEDKKFQPMLKDISLALFTDAIGNYHKAAPGPAKDSYKRLSAYYLVPLLVLDAAGEAKTGLDPADFETYARYLEAEQAALAQDRQNDLVFSLQTKEYRGFRLSDEIYELAKAEIELVAAAQAVAPSPLFTPHRPYFLNDYSQFKPRAHYTKNSRLKSYFIAMMWYGRLGFSLDSPALTRDAIAITGQINTLSAGEESIASLYDILSSAIEFFVGETDDLTPYEYTDIIQKTYGRDLSLDDFQDEAKLREFIGAAVRELPRPRIVSEAVELYDDGGQREELLSQLMQFRFLGQRFTPDAYILNNLTQGAGAPDPETGQNLPSMATALFPVYVIGGGNETVKSYIGQWISAQAPESDRVIAKKLLELRQEFSAYPEAVWTQNIYWSWLNAYRPLLGAYGAGYPYFMGTASWQKKNLATVLGSYAELKHDTLLYAKQSYAELGGGGAEPTEPPPVPKGYVEADHLFWSRLAALAATTKNGLEERNLMPEPYGDRFSLLGEYLEFFRDLAEKQLNNQIISDEDFEKLRKSGQIFKRLADALPGEELALKDRRAGIIADIHTDALKGNILYQATGKPHFIYTAVKDANGARLTRGLVFNHYEFTGPLGERYADEDWQASVYEGEGELPPASAWTRELLR